MSAYNIVASQTEIGNICPQQSPCSATRLSRPADTPAGALSHGQDPMRNKPKFDHQFLARRTSGKHLIHFCGYLNQREWFGDEVQSSIQLPTVNDRVAREPGRVQHFDARPPT